MNGEVVVKLLDFGDGEEKDVLCQMQPGKLFWEHLQNAGNDELE